MRTVEIHLHRLSLLFAGTIRYNGFLFFIKATEEQMAIIYMTTLVCCLLSNQCGTMSIPFRVFPQFTVRPAISMEVTKSCARSCCFSQHAMIYYWETISIFLVGKAGNGQEKPAFQETARYRDEAEIHFFVYCCTVMVWPNGIFIALEARFENDEFFIEHFTLFVVN